MLRLRPRMVMAWQEGTSAKATAESTCACDGKKVVPSPPTEVQLLKAEVRPPVGAQRGDVFGVEELRESVVISNLRRGVERLREQSRRAKERADVATTSLAKARAESVRTTARTRQIKALQEYRELLTSLSKQNNYAPLSGELFCADSIQFLSVPPVCGDAPTARAFLAVCTQQWAVSVGCLLCGS